MKYIFLISIVSLIFNVSCFNNKRVNIEKDTININNDVPIADFKLIVSDIELDHEQFRTNNIRNKEICLPILDTESKLRFRTIINNAASMEPDFDGKYKIIVYGAGSGTTGFFILDLNTGNVYESNSFSYFGMDYNVNSSLLIINPPNEVIKYWEYEYNIIPGWVQIEYLKIIDDELKLILLINSNGETYQ